MNRLLYVLLGAVFGLGLSIAMPTFAQAPVTVDRNDHSLKVGNFVQIPCLIEVVSPSLNPTLSSVGCRTFPNVGSTEYDEGYLLTVYASQVIKP